MQATNATLQPRFVDEGPLLIAGLRETHIGSNAGIPAQWMRFAPHIGRIPGEIDGAAYGICIELCRGEGAGFDYIAGVAVAEAARLPEGLSPLELPARRYAVFQHEGHVSGLPKTVDAIYKGWLPGSGHQPAEEVAFFERYGEEFDPVTGMGGVEVWVPLKG
jgi:AraC family transcriptional regulator